MAQQPVGLEPERSAKRIAADDRRCRDQQRAPIRVATANERSRDESCGRDIDEALAPREEQLGENRISRASRNATAGPPGCNAGNKRDDRDDQTGN